MTKSELIKYSANEVKTNKTLFAHYITLYTEEKGIPPNCASCSFSNVFNNWKLKTKTMKTKEEVKNTFLLKNSEFLVRVPYTNEVLSKNSSDKLALQFLNGDKGKYRTEREKYFLKLPIEKKTKKKK